MRAIVMPTFGMYDAEGTLVRWLKPSGASVAAGESVAEIETEKVLADVTAPESGFLYHVAAPGAMLQVESLLGYVLAAGEDPPEPARIEDARQLQARPSAAASRQRSDVFASPNARRVAAELGVDLAGVRGTGPRGRITEDDVREAKENEAE